MFLPTNLVYNSYKNSIKKIKNAYKIIKAHQMCLLCKKSLIVSIITYCIVIKIVYISYCKYNRTLCSMQIHNITFSYIS